MHSDTKREVVGQVTKRLLYIAPIELKAGSWIAMEAFIGPGVIIGESTVLCARVCITNSIGRNRYVRWNSSAVAVEPLR